MAAAYGYDISQPAKNAKKHASGYTSLSCSDQDSNGAAMSVGRVSTFLDIVYPERFR